jgi:hypothetical protein
MISDFRKLVVVVAGLSVSALAQPAYSPPQASNALLSPIQFNSAQPLDEALRARFRNCDHFDICDGHPVAYRCTTDPNRNTVLLKLANGVVFYDAKMGIDADGSDLAKNNPGSTDQSETSFKYPLPDSPSLDADKVPYIVVPGSDFEKPLGIEVGDIAAVVYGDHLAYAIVGDRGPKCKIGEGSIQLHEQLGHEGCSKRNSQGICSSAGKNSIGSNVLYFIFQGSKSEIINGLNPRDINERLASEGQKLMDTLKNAYKPPSATPPNSPASRASKSQGNPEKSSDSGPRASSE